MCGLGYAGYVNRDFGGDEVCVDFGVVENCFIHLELRTDFWRGII